MAYDAKGKIYIPLEDLWEFVAKYVPTDLGPEIRYGVPRITDCDMEIDYVASTLCDPAEWAQRPSDILDQWKELKK